MIEHIGELLDSYFDFLYKVSEYEMVNGKIKEYVKENGYKINVGYYSLSLNLIDNSVYSDDIIDYLVNNKLDKFIVKGIDNQKITRLIEENLINREYAVSNIEKEKSILGITLKELPSKIESFKSDIEDSLVGVEPLDLIRRRESLKYSINEPRRVYYSKAKEIKDLLRFNEMHEYRFQCRDDVGVIKEHLKERTYTKAFFNYLELNQLDAFKMSVNSEKLRKSKNKKIDREYVNKYREDIFKEYLYVNMLKTVFAKMGHK